MNKFDECQKPFTPCWCSVAGRENNPHCKNVPSVPIDDPIYFLILGLMTIIFLIIKFKPKQNETTN